MTFEPIYFDINKSNINAVSSKALDYDGMLLKDNPNIKVEIGGHTDSGGSEQANLKISEKRALSVKKYLLLSVPRSISFPHNHASFFSGSLRSEA